MPYAMSIGMSEETFWNSNPRRLKVYEDAYLLRKRQNNYEMWLQGQYFMEAYAVVLSKAFGGHGAKYPPKPYDVYPQLDMEKRAALKEESKESIEARQAAMFEVWANKMMVLYASKMDGGGNHG